MAAMAMLPAFQPWLGNEFIVLIIRRLLKILRSVKK